MTLFEILLVRRANHVPSFAVQKKGRFMIRFVTAKNAWGRNFLLTKECVLNRRSCQNNKKSILNKVAAVRLFFMILQV